ncbi:MAG: hypothetical protein ACLSCW_01340 [Gemmiger formicilis]
MTASAFVHFAPIARAARRYRQNVPSTAVQESSSEPYIHRIPPAAEHIDSLQRHGKMRRRAEHELDGKNAQQQQDGPLQAGHPAVDAF